MKLDMEAIAIVFGAGLLFSLMKMGSETTFTQFVLGAAMGGFFGFAALPYFDSKKWRPRPLLCAVIASASAVALALSRDLSPVMVVASGCAGLAIGYFSPYFARYL